MHNLSTNRRTLLYAQLAVLVLLTFLDIYLGVYDSYYWRYPWFDVVTHINGGVWAACFASWLFALRGIRPQFFYCLLIVFAIGVAWEIFEAAVGLTQFPEDLLDTIMDLCNDVIGGALALGFMLLL